MKAIVVLRPDHSVDPDELIALVKEAKGSHYAPKTADFVGEIPLSPLGKPDKKALRAQYWGDAGRQVRVKLHGVVTACCPFRSSARRR